MKDFEARRTERLASMEQERLAKERAEDEKEKAKAKARDEQLMKVVKT